MFLFFQDLTWPHSTSFDPELISQVDDHRNKEDLLNERLFAFNQNVYQNWFSDQ